MNESAPQRDPRIFGYHDGFNDVWADPVAVMGRLLELLDGAPNEVIKARRQKQNEVAAELARRKLVAAAREAFQMQPFDRLTGTGPLDDDCEKVLNDFLFFSERRGTPTAPTRSSPRPSAAPASLVPGLSPLTPVSAVSSTSGDCGCDGPPR